MRFSQQINDQVKQWLSACGSGHPGGRVVALLDIRNLHYGSRQQHNYSQEVERDNFMLVAVVGITPI